jgi:hypothetical protein
MKTRRDLITRIEGASGIYGKWEEFSNTELYQVLCAVLFSLYTGDRQKYAIDDIAEYAHFIK